MEQDTVECSTPIQDPNFELEEELIYSEPISFNAARPSSSKGPVTKGCQKVNIE